jgi:hypothetical protein
LVCKFCLDTPQEQLRAIVVPADPTPIMQARVQDFVSAETDDLTANLAKVTDPTTGIPIPSTTGLLTQNAQNITTQPIGYPNGLEQDAVMPLNGTTHYNVKLPVLSVSANGTTIVTVTCSSVHGLCTNSQISVAGLSNNSATGFYSVTVTTATAFTYETVDPIPTGSLLTSTTNIVTASVGLPYNYPQIPLTGK